MNLLLLFALGILWGASYLFIKVTVAEVPVFTLVAGRVGLAAAVLWLYVTARGLSLSRRRQDWLSYAVIGMFNMAVPHSLICWSEQTIDSGIAALLQSTTPIFTVLMAHYLTEDERLSPNRVAGMALGFLGVSLLMLPDLREGLSGNLPAQLAMVLSSLCYGAMAVFARKRIRGQDPILSTAGILTMAALFTLPVSLIVDQPFHLTPSLPAMASWATLSLLGTVVALVIYYALIDRAGATFASMSTFIIPVNSLILGALVLHEDFSWMVLASLLMVLAGAFLVNHRPTSAKTQAPAAEAAPAPQPDRPSPSRQDRMP